DGGVRAPSIALVARRARFPPLGLYRAGAYLRRGLGGARRLVGQGRGLVVVPAGSRIGFALGGRRARRRRCSGRRARVTPGLSSAATRFRRSTDLDRELRRAHRRLARRPVHSRERQAAPDRAGARIDSKTLRRSRSGLTYGRVRRLRRRIGRLFYGTAWLLVRRQRNIL